MEAKFKKEKKIDQNGLRTILNIWRFPDPPTLKIGPYL